MDFDASTEAIEEFAGEVVEVKMFGPGGEYVGVLRGVLQRPPRAAWPDAAKDFGNPASAGVEFEIGTEGTTFAHFPDEFVGVEHRPQGRVAVRTAVLTFVIGRPERPWVE